jgi:hypothetical protein
MDENHDDRNLKYRSGKPSWDISQAHVKRGIPFGVTSDYQFYSHFTRNESRIPNDLHNGDEGHPVGSTYWKRGVVAMGVGTVCFFGAVVSMFGFAMTQNQVFIYTIGVLTLFYAIVRISLSVYVYKDAKALSAHAVEAQARYHNSENTYSPSAFMWAVFSLISPPFVEYAAVAVYLFRRRQRTGSP